MKLVFLGPPGAGKGTQAEKICEYFGIAHISTGDMLRREMREGTELGNAAKAVIEAGGLVSDDIIIGMVKNRVNEPDCENGFLLDGFPRTIAQAEALEGIEAVDMAVNIDVPAEVLVDRISGRRMCSGCGAGYHISKYTKDTCEKCGGALYIRDDDTEETVVKRFEVYQQQTAPLVEFYQGKGKLYTIDANGVPDEIAKQIRETLEGLKNE